MNTIKNIQSNNIKVSIQKKILNIIMIFVLCIGILFSIPLHTNPQMDRESIIILLNESNLITETTSETITEVIQPEEDDFEDWYTKLIEKQELRKEQHQKELEVCGTVSGAILIIDGIAMVNSQMPWMLSGTYSLVAPGIVIVGAELIVIGAGILFVSLYFMSEENSMEEGH